MYLRKYIFFKQSVFINTFTQAQLSHNEYMLDMENKPFS